MKRASMMFVIAGAAVLAVFVLRVPVAGQPASASQDTLAALLVEVRGLRAAMEQVASAAPRVQLAFGRLQMQEQRVNTLLRRDNELRSRIAEADGSLSGARGKLEEVRRALDSAIDAQKRGELEQVMGALKQETSQLTRNLQRLQAEEADVASQVGLEQSRWTEINQRLEDLERALAR